MKILVCLQAFILLIKNQFHTNAKNTIELIVDLDFLEKICKFSIKHMS